MKPFHTPGLATSALSVVPGDRVVSAIFGPRGWRSIHIEHVVEITNTRVTTDQDDYTRTGYRIDPLTGEPSRWLLVCLLHPYDARRAVEQMSPLERACEQDQECIEELLAWTDPVLDVARGAGVTR